MACNGPERADREGISSMELAQTVPDQQAAREWFEEIYWQGQRFCGH